MDEGINTEKILKTKRRKQDFYRKKIVKPSAENKKKDYAEARCG